MISSSGTAASHLYSSALSTLKSGPSGKDTTPQPSEVIKDYATDFFETLKQGEETAKQALGGQADPASVVQALAASEIAIETAVSVRDKVVEAYQEILRMPV